MSREDVDNIVSSKLTIGLSTIVGITGVAGDNSITFKYFSGGSLEIGGASLTWGSGYLLGTNEIVNIPVGGIGAFYLAATGSTVIAYMLKGRTPGT